MWGFFSPQNSVLLWFLHLSFWHQQRTGKKKKKLKSWRNFDITESCIFTSVCKGNWQREEDSSITVCHRNLSTPSWGFCRIDGYIYIWNWIEFIFLCKKNLKTISPRICKFWTIKKNRKNTSSTCIIKDYWVFH